MSYFTILKHNDRLYQIKDALGSLCTLLIGDKKALVFDTCYGIGNLFETIREITDLPLLVIASHGHMDHTGGNYQFDEVYINSLDMELAKVHNQKKRRLLNLKALEDTNIKVPWLDKETYCSQNEGNLKKIDFSSIDIGGLTLEVVHTPGHTQGSISLYCKEMRLMLVSDAICQYVWLFLEESTKVSEYVLTVKKVLKYDFDYFTVGHGAKLMKKSFMVDYLNVARSLDVTKAIKVSFANFEDLNSYAYSTNGLYSPIGCGLVFDKNKI